MRFALVAENLWQPKVVDTYVKNVRKKSMKVKVIKDKRSEIDKKYDEMWNKLIRDANLNSRQRINNASRNTKRKGIVDVSGKYVILVDDIVTTGASMSVCVKMLMRESAAGVICLSVAGKNKK